MKQISVTQFLAEERRSTLLRLLDKAPGCEASNTLLVRMMEAFGEGGSADSVDNDLAWLEEQGLLTLVEFGNVRIAKLTARGTDVALGHATVPGVARYRPGR